MKQRGERRQGQDDVHQELSKLGGIFHGPVYSNRGLGAQVTKKSRTAEIGARGTAPDLIFQGVRGLSDITRIMTDKLLNRTF